MIDHTPPDARDVFEEEMYGKKAPRWANYRVEIEYPDRPVETVWFREAEHAEQWAEEVFDSMDTSEARETRVEIWRLR